MKLYTLGIDTSCYTSSLAVVDQNGKLVCDKRKMLHVKKGARGLRQSEGFFQHVMNLPDLFSELAQTIDVSQIGCIAVSTRPRNQEGSYMPVFTAGEKFAKTLSIGQKVPMFTTTHQDGHLMASAISCEFDYKLPHLSVHLSGGTSEILMSNWTETGFDTRIVGGTLDVSAGQLLDRIGVALDLSFPCGKALDEIWSESRKQLKFPVSVKETYFNLSGAEAYGLKYVSAGEKVEDISKGLFEALCKTLAKSLAAASKETGITNILMAGGVSSSRYLSTYLPVELKKQGLTVKFCSPSYASDNAIGVALLGRINRGEDHEA